MPPQISPDLVPEPVAPSVVASAASASVPSTGPSSSVLSSPEIAPPQLTTADPRPAAKPTKARPDPTTQLPAVETPIAAPPPPPPPVDNSPPESPAFQVAPEAPPKGISQPSSQNQSPSSSISANNSPAPTPSSKPQPPPPPPPMATTSYPDPRASPTLQQDPTTFRTVTSTATTAWGAKSSSTSNTQATKSSSPATPDATAGKGSGVIASSPFDISSGGQAPPKSSKGHGSTVGGVIGGLTAVTLLGLLLFFLWKWRARRIARAKERLSFGPCGNGIDASTGNALFASVPRPDEGTQPVEPITEKYGHIPPPSTGYFQPAVDNGKRFLRPIDSIEEMSERGSTDVPKKVGFAGTNPFDDKHAIDRMQPTLPSIDLPDEAGESPDRAEKRARRRSQSLGPGNYPQPGTWGSSPQASSTGVWVPPNMNYGNGQERYKNAPITPMRRYPTNPTGGKGPMGGMQSNRRSRSVSGINRYQPGHNPVMNSPAWNRSAPMASSAGRRPSVPTREVNVPVASSPSSSQSKSPMKKPSTGSLRERPSPTNWTGPDTAHPLHQSPHQPQQQQPLARSDTRPMRLGPIDKGPDLAVGSMWGTASNNVESKGGPARNF